jgi:ABC-type sugar transport system substrate-binding protein
MRFALQRRRLGRSKTVTSALCAAALALSVLGACSTEDGEASGGDGGSHNPGDDGDLSVACLPIDLRLEVFKNICDGVSAGANAIGASYTQGDGQSDPGTQARLIETYADQGIDVVVVVAQDPGSFVAPMRRAQAKGTLVYAYGTDVDGSDLQSIFDFYGGGVIRGTATADYINRNMGGEAHVLLFDYPAVPVLADITRGARVTIEQNAPNAVIVGPRPANSREEGLKETQASLQKDPDINVVVCVSDDACLGAWEALSQAGKKADDVFLIGTDGTASGKDAIKSGTSGLKMSVGYGQAVTGAAAVLRAAKCLDGEDMQRTDWLAEFVYTADNVAQFQAEADDAANTAKSKGDIYATVKDTTPTNAATCPPSH